MVLEVIDEFLKPIATLIAKLTGMSEEEALEILKGIVYLVILVLVLVIIFKIYKWIAGRK